MALLVLDFETAYDAKYTLRNLAVPEYVADARFKVLGLAWAVSGNADFSPDAAAALRALQTVYGSNLENVTCVAHNGFFDFFILAWVYGIRPPKLLCTKLMAYHVWGRLERSQGRLTGYRADLAALAERYGLSAKGHSDHKGKWALTAAELADMATYAAQDARLTAQLAPLLAADISNAATELALLHHALAMYCHRWVQIDLTALAALRAEIETATAQFLAAANVDYTTVGKSKAYPELLAKALAATNRLLPLKQGKKGPIPALAKNDPAMLALCQDSDPVVNALANARVKRKSGDQLISRLNKIESVALAMNKLAPGAPAGFGRVPVQLTYYGAHTGRWAGSGGINFQNFGKTGYGCRIRNLIVPGVAV